MEINKIRRARENTLVSVVIPCYNRSGVIGRSISSVFAQSYEYVEIIVVDDYSADSSSLTKVVKSFNDERLQLIVHDCNLGGAAARNTGVRAAKGKYIAFLDSDDEWFPEKLEKQLEAIGEYTNPHLVIYTQSTVMTTQGGLSKKSVMPKRAIGANQSMGDYLFVDPGFLQTSSILVSREIALKVQFNSELGRHQDYDLLLRLEAEGCRFQMIPVPLVVVHWEDMHQSHRGLDPMKSLEFINEYQTFLSLRARAGFIFGQVVMRLLTANRKLEALRYFFMHVNPFYLKFVQYVSLVSGVIFGDSRIAQKLSRLKLLSKG